MPALDGYHVARRIRKLLLGSTARRSPQTAMRSNLTRTLALCRFTLLRRWSVCQRKRGRPRIETPNVKIERRAAFGASSRMHGLGGDLGTTEHSLDVVSVWIQHKGRVITRVILLPQSGCAVWPCASSQGSFEKSYNLVGRACGERKVDG